PEPERRGGARRWIPLLAVLALLGLGGIAVAALSGGGDPAPTVQRTQSEESRAERTPTPTPTETATPTPTGTPEPTPTAEQPDGDPNALNAAGFAKSEAGDHVGAIPLLQGAVDACGDSRELDPCGFALFNLGVALNRAGRPGEAIPFLERRLANFSFKRGVVQAELDAARAAVAGGEEGGIETDDAPGNGNGKGKAKGKKNKG
ncbi:MAG: tetratricopeptide repeat protein, partial [Actinomycetota bacterium]|nr:tetratricopeptide repeat protein [Actinomycetota bacterium]